MVTQQDMDVISRKLFNPIILVLDAWTFQYLVLVYYVRRKEFRVWLLVLASFTGFAMRLYVYDDHDTMSMANTVSETCLQLTFIIQITIIGHDVCVKVKLRSIRWLTHAAEAFVVLGFLQVIASLLDVTGSGTIHLLGNVLETLSLVFVLVFRFYYLSLSRGYRRLLAERKFEILLYTLLAIHEFPFVLLEHHTGVTWEFAQGVCNRVVLAACILQNIRKKAIPSAGSSSALVKSKKSSNAFASMTSSRGSFFKTKATDELGPPATNSRGTLLKLVPRRSSSQSFPDITKIAVISERVDSQVQDTEEDSPRFPPTLSRRLQQEEVPRVSERQRLLRDIVDVMAVATLEEDDDDLLHSAQGRAAVTEDQLLFSDLDEVSDMLQLVESSRYLVDRKRIDSCTQFNAEIFMASYPTSRFRQRTRMDKSSFERVVNKIKDNDQRQPCVLQ
ncbi:hypothetical protein PF008_g16399 [Phytophthora fragariae]|uniref:Uncharacterized protein n=1 Tax=Phytophthora fragariae TaxID=53985 RepID=A0A6G0RBE8_9STRA|nr:hypothetical protein PF008_g16399 [Phytophthora fragariae]